MINPVNFKNNNKYNLLVSSVEVREEEASSCYYKYLRRDTDKATIRSFLGNCRG